MKIGGSSRKDGMLLFGEHYIVDLQKNPEDDTYRYRLYERKQNEEKADTAPKSADTKDLTEKPEKKSDRKSFGDGFRRLMKNGTMKAGLVIGAVGTAGSVIAAGAPKRSFRRFLGNMMVLAEAAAEGYLISRVYGTDGKVLRFHGAEHKVINAALGNELDQLLNKEQQPITLEEAKKASRLSDRCGSNMAVYLTASGMLIGLLPFGDAVTKTLLSFGIGYQAFNAPEESCPVVKRVLNSIGSVFQEKIMTREPDEQILEAAVKGMNLLIGAENGTLPEEEKKQLLEAGKKKDLFQKLMV